jgi:hypothetical protein
LRGGRPGARGLDSGGGIRNAGSSTLNVRNTILAGNLIRFSSNDLDGRLSSSGYNLIGNTQGGSGFAPTDLLDVDPRLGPLQDNGGPTRTMALLPGSPALDAGDNTDAPDFDQRGEGFDRVVGGVIDIGAYEAQVGAATQLVVGAPAGVTSGTPFDVTVTALDAYGHVATGYTGTVTFTTSDTDPAVVLPEAYTFTAADRGTHTFTAGVTLRTPGDQTLTATDADRGLSVSATVTVESGGGGGSSPPPSPGRPGGWAAGAYGGLGGLDLVAALRCHGAAAGNEDGFGSFSNRPPSGR